MPSSPRRSRERANLRERILATALNILESEGVGALTMRRVASDVEYTAPIVYQHFANKDALVLELVAHGYGLMVGGLTPVLHEPDIDLRLLRIASEYVRFAGQHPHLYEAMNATALDAEERRRIAQPTIDILHELLTAWSAAHGVDLLDLGEACDIVWGTLYGIATLGNLSPGGVSRVEQTQRLARHALGAILLGWQSQAPGSD